MTLKKGDFIRVNFTGKIKGTGEVFDTTIESVAKENGIYEPKILFKARPLVIGARHIIPGLDKALEGAELGDKRVVEIPPEDGFGPRDPNKIKVIPLKEFKQRGVNPVPGMRIELENNVGRVQSVSGGRVRVDLNHGLAGKVLDYEYKVEEKTNKTEEKIRMLLELYITSVDAQEFDIQLIDGKADITLPEALKFDSEAAYGKLAAVRDIFTYIKNVDNVVFKEVHNRLKSKKEDTKPNKKAAEKKKPQKKPAKPA